MELLDGEDLGKRLTRLGRMSPPDLVRIIGQVSRALTKAHQLGIVHRDLKPDNIFLVRDDDREIAKVLDFGIAKSVGHDLSSGSSTKTGAMLGTPFYMSPEQAQGTKQVDARSDLWAMAIICFEALTGRRLVLRRGEALKAICSISRSSWTPLPMPSGQFAQVPGRRFEQAGGCGPRRAILPSGFRRPPRSSPIPSPWSAESRRPAA